MSEAKTYRIGQLFRDWGEEFIARFKPSGQAIKVIRSIRICRTPALGGMMVECQSCDHRHFIYKSCGNRYCPICQNIKKEIWLDKVVQLTLPTTYFHTIFTLPSELRPLAKKNKKVCYNILFRASSRALQQLCKEQLGIKTGLISMLHTWGQNLSYHPHIHTIVPNGGVDLKTGQWVEGKLWNYLIHPSDLGDRFKEIYLELLQKSLNEGDLVYDDLDLVNKVISKVKEIDWIVWNQAPAKGVAQLYEYLGRYVHRVAIADSRIEDQQNNTITITYKDYRKQEGDEKPKIETLILGVFEFIRRFLQHLLPVGFQKVRYYGILSSAWRKKLRLLQSQLNVSVPPKRSTEKIIEKLIGAPVNVCQNCGMIDDFVTFLIPADPDWKFRNIKHLRLPRRNVARPPPQLSLFSSLLSPPSVV